MRVWKRPPCWRPSRIGGSVPCCAARRRSKWTPSSASASPRVSLLACGARQCSVRVHLRNEDPKGCAVAYWMHAAAHPDGPVMVADHAVAQPQPQPSSLFALGGEEGFEQPREVPGLDS